MATDILENMLSTAQKTSDNSKWTSVVRQPPQHLHHDHTICESVGRMIKCVGLNQEGAIFCVVPKRIALAGKEGWGDEPRNRRSNRFEQVSCSGHLVMDNLENCGVV